MSSTRYTSNGASPTAPPSPGRRTMWNTTLRTKTSNLSAPPTSSSSSKKDRKRREEEAREIRRIMDESYLPRSSSSPSYYGYTPGYGHGYENGRSSSNSSGAGPWRSGDTPNLHYVHDIDHRPFPPILPLKTRRATTTTMTSLSGDSVQYPGGRFDNGSGGRGWNQRSPSLGSTKGRTQAAPPAYWETFNLPQSPQTTYTSFCPSQFVSEPEEAELGLGLEGLEGYYGYPPTRSVTATAPTSGPEYGYFDSARYAAVGVDDANQGRRRVLRKKQSGVKATAGDGGTGVYYADGGENKGQREEEGEKDKGRVIQSPSPKDKLHRTWVATRFGVHLKVIRTQRWLREHI